MSTLKNGNAPASSPGASPVFVPAKTATSGGGRRNVHKVARFKSTLQSSLVDDDFQKGRLPKDSPRRKPSLARLSILEDGGAS
jgi:hypothetical protein